MRFRSAVAASFTVFALSSVGCAHQVQLNPRAQWSVGEKIPLRARYYIAPVDQARVHSDSFFALGKAHTWNIEIGAALALTFPEALGTVFASVAPASGPEDIGDADVLLIPSLGDFAVDGGSFKSTLEVRVRGADRTRRVLLDEVLVALPAEGTAGSAWTGGVFAGKSALQRSAEYAFEDVMPRIADKTRQAVARLRSAKKDGPAS